MAINVIPVSGKMHENKMYIIIKTILKTTNKTLCKYGDKTAVLKCHTKRQHKSHIALLQATFFYAIDADKVGYEQYSHITT